MTPQEAYDHCLEHGRNAELEKIVLTNPYYAYLYARDVIRGRWKEAEEIISTDSGCACLYAKGAIKGKLPENMHNMMLLHADECAKEYLDFINKHN